MNARNGAFESHALTILPTMRAFAEAERALGDRGAAAGKAGFAVLESVLRSPIAAEDCPSGEACSGHASDVRDQACWLGPARALKLHQFPGDHGRIASSADHVFDRLAEARAAGAISLAEALGRSVSARDAEEFARAVLGGSVLIWTMATSFEEASAITSLLLERSAERVCTFTSARGAVGRNGSGGEGQPGGAP